MQTGESYRDQLSDLTAAAVDLGLRGERRLHGNVAFVRRTCAALSKEQTPSGRRTPGAAPAAPGKPLIALRVGQRTRCQSRSGSTQTGGPTGQVRDDLGGDWIRQEKDKSSKGEAPDQHGPVSNVETKKPSIRGTRGELGHEITSEDSPSRHR
jgi:hypothetical protein